MSATAWPLHPLIQFIKLIVTRDIKSIRTKKFKFELDKYLELIPEEPNMPNYVIASGSNSILDRLSHLRAQGIYETGGVPDLVIEQSYLL